MSVRSNDDSWDLSSSVGSTATMVAASRALASSADAPLIDDPYAEPLVRAVGMPFFTKLLDGEVPAEHPDYDVESSANHMAVRTRFYDDVFLDAARAGVRQAVILAAGLDTRAYRLPWANGTTVFELDLPKVLAFKTETLTELGAEPTAVHRPIAVDLRDDWPKALRDAGFDATQPTVWSAEGLLVYLPPAAQDALLDNITTLSAPGSRMAADCVPDMSVFATQAAANPEAWDRMEISINDLIYHGDRNHAPDYLAERGWTVGAKTIVELHRIHGLSYPEGEMFEAFADVTYLNAEFTGRG